MPSSPYLKFARTFSFVFATLAIMCGFEHPYAQAAIQHSANNPRSSLKRSLVYNVPVSFEPNQGQASPAFEYVAHEPGLGIGLRSDGIYFMALKQQPVRVQFIHSNSGVALTAENELPGKVNYLRGTDSDKWRTNISTFARVRYRELYPGIDLVFYGNGRQVEHDFLVSPGSDPSKIKLQIKGARAVRVNQSGDLIADTSTGRVIFRQPFAYQEGKFGREAVEVRFDLRGSQATFHLGAYDPSRALVIDPVLDYSTLLAGSISERASGIAIDAAGNAIVTGITTSTDFPTTTTPYQKTCKSCGTAPDIFVTKLNSTGTAALYSTYIGGSNDDEALGLAVDSNGNAIVGGATSSPDFPLLHSYTTYQGATNTFAFVLSLSADGSSLNYSSLLGRIPIGFPAEQVSVAVDGAGGTYVTGQTFDVAFPITPGTVGSTVPGYPFNTLFLTKLNTAGTIQYSTVIQGTLPTSTYTFNENDFQPKSIAVDGSGNAYIVGQAGTGLPTTAGTISTSFPGDTTNLSLYFGFALKVNATASAITYATYLPDTTSANAIAPDTNGAYIAGVTSSTAFPATPGAFQSTLPVGQNCTCNAGYVAHLDAGATKYTAATFLAGTPATSNLGTTISSLGTDNLGMLWAGGGTASSDFPLKNPIISTFGGSSYAGFVTEIKPDLSAISFSTFLSGSNDIYSNTSVLYVAPAANGIVVAAGTTGSPDFPTTPLSFEPLPPSAANPYNAHAFVAKIDTSVASGSACFSSTRLDFGSWLVNTPSPKQVVSIQNCGNSDLHVQSISITGTDFSQTNTCSTVVPGATCQISVAFTPSSTVQQTQTMTVKDDSGTSTQTISLTGKGGQPVVQVFAPTFGDLLVGTSGIQEGITLLNVGDGNLLVSNSTVSGDFAIAVSTYKPCTGPIAPNDFCELTVVFSPTAAGTRSGTLTISDNATDSPQQVGLTGNGVLSYPTPQISKVLGIPVGSSNLTAQITGNYFFPTSTVQWNGSSRTAAYQDENHIWVTLNASDVSSVAEVPVTVTNSSPGGGVSNTAMANIFIQLNQSTARMLYDANSKLLYATVPAAASSNANTILEIDPITGIVTNTISIGNDPHALALSDDGTLLYVGLNQTGEVAQLSLPSGSILGRVTLPADSFLGQTVAQDIRILPGNPHAYAVALLYTKVTPGEAGVIVFDDQQKRLNGVGGFSSGQGVVADSLLFLSDPTMLYASGPPGWNLYRLIIDATGVSLKDSISGINGNLTTDGKLLFLSSGQVVDPVTATLANTITPPSQYTLTALRPVANDGRIYTAASPNPSASGWPYLDYSLNVLDLQALNPLGAIHIPWSGLGENVQTIERWGGHGLALQVNNVGSTSYSSASVDNIDILTSSLVQASPTPPSPPVPTLASISPTNAPAGSAAITLTINGTGFVNSSVAQVNNVPRSTAFVSSTQLTATLPASDLISIGSLQITVFTPAPGGGTSTALSFGVTGVPSVQFSTNTLDFGSETVGTATSSQAIVITNSGSTNLHITGIAVSGDFTQTGNCGQSLAVGTTCQVSVAFNPSVAGGRSGSLIVTDDASGSPQSVALSGTGTDMQITSGSGTGPIATTVSSGQTATYNLNLTSQSGFTGAVTFSCSGAPQYSTCAVTPSSLNLAANGTAAITVNVLTGQTVSAQLTHSPSVFFGSVGLLGILCLLPIARLRKRFGSVLLLQLLLIALGSFIVIGGMVACGGGSSSTPPPGGTTVNKVAPGSYVLILTATSGNTVRTVNMNLTVQ